MSNAKVFAIFIVLTVVLFLVFPVKLTCRYCCDSLGYYPHIFKLTNKEYSHPKCRTKVYLLHPVPMEEPNN